MRRAAVVMAAVVVALAGCGGGKVVAPKPETVVGTVPTVAAGAEGKAVFDAQGCGSCHTFKPAGSKGTVGPDLDKLPDYAKKAGKPLADFVRESIVKPNAYVESGFQPNVMPDYSKLSEDDVNALVDFLTQSQS
jgi:cytochrome c oxidase subunit 2